MNPAVTLTFLCLGKIGPRHAFAYAAAQFMRATLGIGCALAFLEPHCETRQFTMSRRLQGLAHREFSALCAAHWFRVGRHRSRLHYA